MRHARLLDGRLVDLLAEDGRWTRIGEAIAADGAEVVDAEGRLVTPPLVDCHLHLDASLTAGNPRWNESGTLIEGIHVWGELKPSLTEQDVFERAREIVRWSVAQGTLFIRAHADVSGENDAMVRGLLRLRDEVADLCTVQVTAFPQDGIFARDGDEERLENALRLGVDCVGGIPHFEPTSELGLKEVHRVFDLAKKYSRRVDVHCDETDDPNSRFLEVMADDTVKFGLGGRVTASHCTAMGSYEPYYSSKLHGFLLRAGINIVVNPFANSLIQGRLDVYPKRRGFAQLKELLAAGVNVSLGNDVIMDPWYSMGRADMIEAASLALALHLHERPRGDPRDAPLRHGAGRPHAGRRGRVRPRSGKARGSGRLRRAERSRGAAPSSAAALGDQARHGRRGDDARPHDAARRAGDVHTARNQRVCGNPRSTFDVAGSGQRDVTTLPRV